MSADRLSLPAAWGSLLAAAGTVSLFAGYWDDAWHTDVGRDDATIPPHLLLYGSVAVAGVVVVAWGLRVLRRTRSLGATLRYRPLIIAGAGGAATLAAAPVDAAWHTAFGRDAVLWSPPHMLVVLASTSMVVGALAGLRPTRRGLVEAALSGLLLGSLLMSVLEYETDVPQFAEALYLPVLLATATIAAAIVRDLVPHRAPVIRMVLAYVAFRLVTTAVLAMFGRTAPDLPIAVLGLMLVDLPWRSATTRYAAGAAGISALAWASAALDAASLGARPVAVAAVPVVAVLVLTLTVTGRGRRPLAFGATTAVLAVGTLTSGGERAEAHDPGQGRPVASATVTGSSNGRGMATLTVRMPDGCDGTTPRRLVARRAGETVTSQLTAVGDCRYTGTVRLPDDGRWFVYAELRVDGQDAETWLAIRSDAATEQVESRDLYVPVGAGTGIGPVQLGTGALVYAVGLALFALSILGARAHRASSRSGQSSAGRL
jgi:hypothetical protein